MRDVDDDRHAAGVQPPAAPPSDHAAVRDLAQARRRLASLPVGFTDWVGTAPVWPADVPEIIGPRAGEAG